MSKHTTSSSNCKEREAGGGGRKRESLRLDGASKEEAHVWKFHTTRNCDKRSDCTYNKSEQNKLKIVCMNPSLLHSSLTTEFSQKKRQETEEYNHLVVEIIAIDMVLMKRQLQIASRGIEVDQFQFTSSVVATCIVC